MNDMTMDAPKRPTLLTVICILSFIMGAIGLWSGYMTAFTDKPQRDLEKMHVQNQEMIDQMGDANPMLTQTMESGIAMQENVVAHAKPMGYGGLVFSVISVIGVWLMWNLKKNGFWLYLLAAIGGLVIDFMYMTGGLMANIGIGGGILITAVFVILYGVNLKHMR